MDLYSNIVDVNEDRFKVLELLGLTELDLGRFRDAYLSVDGTKAFVFHRNYQGNCEWVDDFVSRLSTFVRKFDNGDYTYSTYEFNVPDDKLAAAKILVEKPCNITSAWEKMQRKMADMQNGKITQRDIDFIKSIADAMQQAIETGETISVNGVVVGQIK